MLSATRGIVLHKTKYSDTSLIVKIFTEEFGLKTYLVQGARGKKSKARAILFQPLALLELEVHHREKSSLQRIRDLKPFHPFTSIPYDVVKSTMVLFLNEVLYKSIKSEAPDRSLFEFVSGAISWLDLTTDRVDNFHLLFLLRLARHLGFYPQGSYSAQTPLFDMVESTYRANEPLHSLFLDPHQSAYLWQLLGTNFEGLGELRMPSEARRKLLNGLVDYFRVHIEGLTEIKSHQVLETIVGSSHHVDLLEQLRFAHGRFGPAGAVVAGRLGGRGANRYCGAHHR